ILDEVRRAQDTILFLPDAITSLGTSAGGPSAERVHVQLLAAQWTEQVRCIFTATAGEYQRCLQRRPGLAGSVQEIVLRPATPGEAIDVLRGVRDRYQAYHRVRIAEEAISATVELAGNFPGAFPGKAVTLLDRACARSRSKADALSPEPEARLREIETQIEQLNSEKEAAVAAQDFARGLELRDRADALKNEKERLLRERPDRGDPEVVVDSSVVEEVAREIATLAPAGPAPV
ncbi:MAG: hypothetical protein J2P46_11430, partial [Zavarzinella sp.]|nr:hypothetical protein [Zavarzinella sp.]